MQNTVRKAGASRVLSPHAAAPVHPRLPVHGGAYPLLDLQRASGNQYAQRFLQRKLAIGPADDVYEREAERIAESVVNGQGAAAIAMPFTSGGVQRSCSCGGTCEHCQSQGNNAPGIVAETLRSPGAPLATGVRARMEESFGADFSSVRVHSDPTAAESARAVRAKAYTVGSDIAFAAGHYAPGNREGDRLLAHELTHVLQQSGTAPSAMQRQVDPHAAPTVAPPVAGTATPDPIFTLEGSPTASAVPSFSDNSSDLATDVTWGDFALRGTVHVRADAASNFSDWQVGIIQMVSGPVDTTCFQREVDRRHPPATPPVGPQVFVNRLALRPGPFYPDKDPAYPGVFTDSSSVRTVPATATSPAGAYITLTTDDHPGFQTLLAASAFTNTLSDTDVVLNHHYHHGFFYTYIVARNSVTGRMIPLYTAQWWMSADYSFFGPGAGIPFTPVRRDLVFQMIASRPFRSSDFWPVTTGITMNVWGRTHRAQGWESACPPRSQEIIRAGGG